MQPDAIQTIRIQNGSASVLVRSYACTGDGLLVWLEMAPQHPKLIGAIWASLVNGHKTYLQLKDNEKGFGKAVYGLSRSYTRLEADAPSLAVGHGAHAKLTRLIAPEALKPVSVDQPFYVLAWPDISPEMVLAATLEKTAPYPVRIKWGSYLLQCGLAEGTVNPLLTGGAAPAGYEVQPTSWMDIISGGLRNGDITLES
jgi:hypothetical protein